MKDIKRILNMFVFAAILLLPRLAFAEGEGGEGDADIWGTLATKAGIVGGGLTGVGYIIAGLGLIIFSFMAIFNKIKWSTLAYIMMSTFVLSAMVFVIKMMQDGGDSSWIGGVDYSTSGGTEIVYDADQVTVSKGGN